MTEPPPSPQQAAAGLPASAASARERRLRAAVATAAADRVLLEQGLPPTDDPQWEGDPFGEGIVVDEYDERQFRLWALQDAVRDAQQDLDRALTAEPADAGAVQRAQERLGEARLALGRARLEDDAPFTDAAWRLDLAQFREAGREASRRWAEDAALLHALAVRVPRTMGDTRGATPWTSFLQELAVARSWSTRAVTAELEQARVLVEDLPRTHGALGSGVLAVPAARALVAVAADAPVEVRSAVDALALDVVGLPAWRVRDLALRALLQADPAAAARRAARGARDRGVSVRPLTDERVEISVVGPAVAGSQAYAALDVDARALRAAGDPRTLAQLRFDLFVQRALAGHVLPEGGTAAPAAAPVPGPAAGSTVPPLPHGPARPDDRVPHDDSGLGSGPDSGRDDTLDDVLASPPPLPDRGPRPAWDDPEVLLAGLAAPQREGPSRTWPNDDDAEPCASCRGPAGPPLPAGLAPPPDPTSPRWLTDRRLSRNVRVEVTVPVTTARGLDDEPGWLAGYGWVSAPTVRALLPAAELRQLCVVADGQQGAGTVVDRDQRLRRPAPTPAAVAEELDRMLDEPFPITAVAWQEQPQHDPSPALADLVRARDRYDDGPVVPRVPAERADLDHDVAFAQGGPTAASNLTSRGGRTHDLKHGWRGAGRARWDGTRTADGTLWRSPAGQSAWTPRWSAPPRPVTADRRPDPLEVQRRDDALREHE